MTKKVLMWTATLAVAAGAVASLDGHLRGAERAAKRQSGAAAATPRPALAPSAWRTEVAGTVAIRERDALDGVDTSDVSSMTTAEVDDALAALVGDAESYWELSQDAREQYDALVAQQHARRGLGSLAVRMASWEETLTLDGEVVR